MNNTGAIILAAGKGSRMKAKESNKVTFVLGDRPMIAHVANLAKESNLSPVIIVVGFAKDSVKKLFNSEVIFAEQNKRLGTAHAALQGLKVLPEDVENVFILNGDDSAFYTTDILERLYKEHVKNNNAITFLTLKVENPFGLGRIIRNEKNEVVAIFEEKDSSEIQRKIKEINPACYLFSSSFLKKYLSKVPKSKVTGEYYLVSLIALAINKGERVEGIREENIPWRGVNTGDELKEAEELYLKINGSRSK